MNKLFKLIWVNLLSLFDINKIIIAREDGVKSNLEKRTIMVGIVVIVYAILGYVLLTSLPIKDKYYILTIGFILSTILSFVMNIFVIEPLIFKNNDNDILFSFPITRHQILFSKLFTIYLKNILIVGIIMLSSFLSFYKFDINIGETQALMYILITLVIPFIPMIIATLIAYVTDYLKLKYNNKIRYKLIITGFILIILGIFLLVFDGIKINSVNQGIVLVIERLNYIYPLINLFHIAISKTNILYFLLIIGLSVLLIWLYNLLITKNYLKICSLLKGVNKKEAFNYKKVINLHRVFGIVRKELHFLRNNRNYFNNSFGVNIFGTCVLFILLNFINIDKIRSIDNMNLYINLYLPTMLAMLVSFGNSTISSMSLEKDSMQMLRTMPIGMWKVILGKWLTNIIIGSVFAIINAFIVSYYLSLNKLSIFFSVFLPLFALMFVSLTGIVLDYRFIEKNENNDNAIIKQRIITMFPPFISILIGIIIFFIPIYKKYYLLLGAYMLIFIIFMIIEIIYLVINKEKLLRNLFN